MLPLLFRSNYFNPGFLQLNLFITAKFEFEQIGYFPMSAKLSGRWLLFLKIFILFSVICFIHRLNSAIFTVKRITFLGSTSFLPTFFQLNSVKAAFHC